MAKAVFPPTEETMPHLVAVPQANTGTATDVSCHHIASHQVTSQAAPHLIPDQVLVLILLVHILPAGIRQAAPALNKPAAATNGLTGEHVLADLLAIPILRLLPLAPPLPAAAPLAADHPAVLVRQAIIGYLITEAGAHLTAQALRQAHLQRLLQPPAHLRRPPLPLLQPPARLLHQQQNLRLSLLRLLLLRLRPNLNLSLLHPND